MHGFSLICWMCAGAAVLLGLIWTNRRIGAALHRAAEPTHCPVCAYDLAGLDASLCPECGLDAHGSHTAARIRALIRACIPGAAALLLAAAAAVAPVAVHHGPLALAPTSALIAMLPWAPGDAAALHEELIGRIRAGDLSPAQGRMLAARCAHVIADHTQAERRAGAARVLGASPDRSAATAEAVALALRSPDQAVRLAVLPACGDLSRRSPLLRDALIAVVADDRSELARARAVDALRRGGGLTRTALAVLSVAAESDSPRLRQRAIYAIGANPSAWKRSERVLAVAVCDSDHSVREAALVVLGDRARTDTEAVSLLADGLSDPSPELRIWTASRLRGLGPAALKALPALLGATTDRDDEVRAAAGDAIQAVLRGVASASSRV